MKLNIDTILLAKKFSRCPHDLVFRFYHAMNMVLTNIPFCINIFIPVTQDRQCPLLQVWLVTGQPLLWEF
jgi:hypothetical protein